MPYDKQRELQQQYQRHLQSLDQDLRERWWGRPLHSNYVISQTKPGTPPYPVPPYPVIEFDGDRPYFVCYPETAEQYSDLIANHGGNIVQSLRTRDLTLTILPDNLTVTGDLVVGEDVPALPDNLSVGNDMHVARNYNGVEFQNLTVRGAFIAECIANFAVEIATDAQGFVKLNCGDPELCWCKKPAARLSPSRLEEATVARP